MSIKSKYHPGAYTFVAPFQTGDYLTSATEDDVFLGAQIVYTWRELENGGAGVYDFSRITSDLATLQAAGKRLWIQINDVWFVDGAAYYPCPDYIITYGGQVALTGGGYIATRWDSYVTQQYNALLAALGTAFDGEAYIEGINMPETAIALDDESCVSFSGTFTHQLYYTMMASRQAALTAAFPNTHAVHYVTHWPNCVYARNMFTQKLRSNAIALDLGIGGPDLITNNKFLNVTAFPNFRKVRGVYPLAGAVQYSDFRQSFTTKQIMQRVFEDLRMDYGFFRYQDADLVRDDIGLYVQPPHIISTGVAVAGYVDVDVYCGTPGASIYYETGYNPDLPDKRTSTLLVGSTVSVINGGNIIAKAYVGSVESNFTRLRVAV